MCARAREYICASDCMYVLHDVLVIGLEGGREREGEGERERGERERGRERERERQRERERERDAHARQRTLRNHLISLFLSPEGM